MAPLVPDNTGQEREAESAELCTGINVSRRWRDLFSVTQTAAELTGLVGKLSNIIFK